ncbi:MAG: filamentous hemagglutinin N-terminal domain-containing protein [Gomphosphaeria aponina SAG 52.96 = DSM 107014]|uniref:Filamentous hemagglutinin N-terminal domain-containing protein n=1 Tax=Gomphosphaeria aponina SAG 52.96 = DSM 107014 TaxID=1521640 RepID=A0A941GWS5_9CHRO|nr:filamentous hemagglutinin N-terminal domain-containing protein [Gomphosphaeria aponina SAG 52.96 = DSM 107014]
MSITGVSQAQVSSDGTVSTIVTTSDQKNFTVTGGELSGSNLFHSFQELSVPTDGSINFGNHEAVQNIISRVTGGSLSSIDGIVQAGGAANLFLINPHGIIFGSNAQLQIGGSFLATTAESINFADGSIFSATNLQTQPLLTMSIPIGLQFGSQPASIVNQSAVFPSIYGFPKGLQVLPEKTLALVGGEIMMEGGSLSAPGGRIELGSVGANSFVGIILDNIEGWRLGYEGVESFNDIRLANNAIADTSYDEVGTSGSISVSGRNVTLVSGSGLGAVNLGLETGSPIVVKATEMLELNGSAIATAALSSGKAGDIIIETQRLLLVNYSFIDVSPNNDGAGGNILINASELVQLGDASLIQAQAYDTGDGGNIQIATQKLMLTEGGRIATSTFGQGDGGNININATELVQIEGEGVFNVQGEIRHSAIEAFTDGATGNGGNINLSTGQLLVQDSGRINVASVNGSQGEAGTANINASESITLRGINTTVEATSDGTVPAGNLNINTNTLQVLEGAKINVLASGTGAAGNIQVSANSLLLETGGQLNAATAAGEGNINVQIQDSLILRNQGEITTNATGTASGGNINLGTATLTALDNSKISANAQQGFGGEVIINTQGIFVSPDSAITATSELGPQFNGIVEINGVEIDPNQELASLPQYPGVAPQITQGCQTGGGGSSFVSVGKGGITPGLEEFGNNTYWDDLREPNLNESASPVTMIPAEIPHQIIEATGWIVDEKGEVTLVAKTSTPSSPQFFPNWTTCYQ